MAKITIDIPDETYEDLKAIADRRKEKVANALVKAIATRKFIDDQQAAGGNLLIEKAGELRQVDFK